MTAWTYLFLAGVFEVGFTTALKLEQHNKNWGWAFLFCAVASFQFLSKAIETLPLGTAYAIWTGIGAVGTLLVGRIFFKEQLGWPRLALLAVMVACILGLKVVS